MANKLKVQIQEKVEELEYRLERAMTAVSTRKTTGLILANVAKSEMLATW
ncbi:hypothetical protein QUA40_00750 [Microcoleus sp. Pol11C3]